MTLEQWQEFLAEYLQFLCEEERRGRLGSVDSCDIVAARSSSVGVDSCDDCI